MQHNSRLEMRPSGGWSYLNFPRLSLFVATLLIVLLGVGLGGVSKDPSVDAFVPDDHPAAVARDTARSIFGLEDPVVVGLTVPTGKSAFTPAGLEALRRVDTAIREIEGVKHNDVVSLASESAIRGVRGDLIVEPIISDGVVTEEAAALAWSRFNSMPMLSGLLASESGDMLVIIAPVVDANQAGDTVSRITSAAIGASNGALEVNIAGVAAMNARLAEMVDTDTRIFVPAAIVTVLALLFVALRTGRALLGPLFVIAGSAAMAIGLMGWIGSRYYLITTALPVVIMAIAVADTLHIATFYLNQRRASADCTATDAMLYALRRTWLPITLTSITTIAAFVGLSFGAAMTPISEFGLFAAAGVAAAWLLSLVGLPAIYILSDVRPGAVQRSPERQDRISQITAGLSELAFNRPRSAIVFAVTVMALLTLFATQASFDYERQRYFVESDEVRLADNTINKRLGGINFLDVVVSAPQPGGLITPDAIGAIAQLRQSIRALPLVVKATGIDQYVSLMHTVLNDAAPGSLPTHSRAPGQYMFLYEASGEPDDFKQEIDYPYSNALIRAQLSTDRYSKAAATVDALEALTKDWSLTHGLNASVSGRVAVNDGWMGQLATNHFRGLALATALVLFTAVLVFRSLAYAVLAMMPLLIGVLTVYATMGAFGIDIAPATSMTAAIATGLGVDFGIHLISHIRTSVARGQDLASAIQGHYHLVTRACFFSAVALGIALAVICISSAPPLRWFGFLVSVGAFGSLVGALIIIPAMLAISTLTGARRFQHA